MQENLYMSLDPLSDLKSFIVGGRFTTYKI